MDYPTPDSLTSQPSNVQKRSYAASQATEEAPKKRQKWEFKPLSYSGPEDLDSDLCQRCQTIDFEAIFQQQVDTREGIPVFAFGLHPISTESSCSMCAYLVHEISKPENKAISVSKHGWHLRAHRPWSLCATITSRRDKQRCGIVLRLHPGRPYKGNYNHGSRCSLLMPAHKANEFSSSRVPCMQGQTLSPPNFNFATLQAPLKWCIDTHQCTRTPAPVVPDSTKYIDCETRKLVSLSRGAQYIALSYVWGKQQLSEEEAQEEASFVRDSGCLPVKIPQTIEDAIRVVLLSQQRYLWVDRYCIDQYHSAQKRIQISAMASIYEGALFTVIALGDDADSGLHGISVPFNEQLRFKVRGYEYLSTGQSLQDHLLQSTWAQRAWVYQEAVLSRRCLIFTPDQAFLICLQSTASQVLPSPVERNTNHQQSQDQQYFSPKMIRPLQHIEQMDTTYSWLESHLNEYNRRSMTKKTDALNAFRGILSRCGLFSWWGVPMHRQVFRNRLRADDELTSRFVCGLLWKTTTPRAAGVEDNFDQRSKLPSWTWAALRPTTIAFPELSNSSLLSTMFCPELSVVGKDGAEAVTFARFAGRETYWSLPESTSIILLKSYSIEMNLDGSDRLFAIGSQRALTPKLKAQHRNWDVHWDYAPSRFYSEGKTLKGVTALLMRTLAYPEEYFLQGLVAAASAELVCDWLIVEEFEEKPARRLGVMTTELRALDQSALTWRSIELG